MAILIVAGCGLFIAASPAESPIGENAARKLAIDQYNQLFHDKFIFNLVDSKYHQFQTGLLRLAVWTDTIDRCEKLLIRAIAAVARHGRRANFASVRRGGRI